MKKIFDDVDEYYILKDFVISQSQNPNGDKCCILNIDDLLLTMCFNDKNLSVYICCKGDAILSEKETPFQITLFDFLLHMSKKSIVDQRKINFYYNYIEYECDCCKNNE